MMHNIFMEMADHEAKRKSERRAAARLTPDICTGQCSVVPQDYCPRCSHAVWFGKARVGRFTWRWEHNHGYGGPLFFRKGKGAEIELWPGPRNPVWGKFEAWLKRKGIQ